VHFALGHDDGQAAERLEEADVIIVGVSRTSKTPTCMYLANRGVKAANVPLVPGVALPDAVLQATRPLVVGLTKDPNSLVEVRRTRLRHIGEGERETDYVDPELVKAEVLAARRLFTQQGWPMIDVSRRSIEETAAAILGLLQDRAARAPA
jgi:regulator of PEP synthase PpsR (kinase-PPPase family)